MDIVLGLNSGCDRVFKKNIGNLYIMTGEKRYDKYIMLKEYPCENKEINEHLSLHKNELINRDFRYFKEDNWWKWQNAPDRIRKIERHYGKDCIYVKLYTTDDKIAFKDKVQYFKDNMVMLFPKSILSKNSSYMEKLVELLNTTLKSNYTTAGLFMIEPFQLNNFLNAF